MPATDKLIVRDWGDFYSLLEEAIEEHAAGWGTATIEPERKFIQIIAQVFMTNSTLMSPHQPSLEERHDPMDSRQKLARGFLVSAEGTEFMDITFRSQRNVAQPPVSMDYTPRFDRFFHEGDQTFCGSIWYPLHPNPSDTFAVRLSSHNTLTLQKKLVLGMHSH